ncbi:MAG: hypothetical protein EA401_07985 [Planctomycetota bacterium]|nr:MAG: hypothetical protein EA401_07985 [Planctomycetota bacterium]
MKPELLVIGAGSLAHALAQAQTYRLIGIRRRRQDADFPLIIGDAADDATWENPQLPAQPHAVLITATPGLRGGGRGNRLLEVIAQLHRHYSHCPWIYTGSTAVYGSSPHILDDHAPVQAEGRAPQLRAIEEAVLAHAPALVLRIGAIVGTGPSRRDLSRSPLVIPGDPQRPFPYVHQYDLLQVLHHTVQDPSAQGVMNVVAPHACSYAEYYQQLQQQQFPQHPLLEVVGDPQRPQPWRRIIAPRLWAYMPDHPWLLPWQQAES